MNPEEEHLVTCPYCGETINIMVDCTYINQKSNQNFIEDCQVCCRPINFHINYTADNSIQLSAAHENE